MNDALLGFFVGGVTCIGIVWPIAFHFGARSERMRLFSSNGNGKLLALEDRVTRKRRRS